MKELRHGAWLICILFFLSCARQTAPTGGPRDTIPPVLISSIPTPEQTNYRDNTIQLTFNEMLILNNPKEQLIIIPDVEKKYEIQLKKNRVRITFEQPLQENTTYSLNFRDAIQDITEKNPAPNLKLAFSTGDYIDSLRIAGKILHLLKQLPVKDATVALYQSDTFDIFQHRPLYFSKTDEDGNYDISNLKPGIYYLYAFEDKNKNLLIESKSESFGFLANPINLIQNADNIDIPLIRLDTRPLKLTSARPYNTYYNIKTTKELASYELQSTDSTHLYTAYGEDQSNIRIYNTFTTQDSLLIRLQAIDSLQQKVDTTLWLKFSQRQAQPEKFTATTQNLRLIGTKGLLTGTVIFNKPLKYINYDSLFYQIDSASTIPLTPDDLQIDSSNNTLHIHKVFDKTLLTPPETEDTHEPRTARQFPKSTPLKTTKSNTSYDHRLYMAPNTFISIENDSSLRISQNLRPTTAASTGVLIAATNTNKPDYLIQLLTKDYKLVQQAQNQPQTSFEDLEPTTYQLRLVIDQNADHQWSPGNYYLRQEPEPVFFYHSDKKETTINLKANWELGPLLIKPE